MTGQPPDQHEETLQLVLHQRQLEVYQCQTRFRVLVAGRRFGKTHLALIEIFMAAQGPGKLVWYIGPSDDQSKQIAWDGLKTLTRPYWSGRPIEEDRRIDLCWGSTIFVKGGFKPDNLRGRGLDFIVIDEAATTKQDLWKKVLRAALADKKGRALFIGTPQGHNHFYDLFCRAESDPDWASFQFSTAQGGIIDQGELLSISRDLDPESFSQELEAQFSAGAEHRAYHCFDRADHIKPVSFCHKTPLVWSLDFNVNPMCMLLIQQHGEVVHVIEEIVIRPEAHTQLACDRFFERAQFYYNQLDYMHRPLNISIFGDASGNQHRTAGAETDWAIVRQSFTKWVGTFVPKYNLSQSNPPVRDRINCVNARLRNHAGDIRLFVDPRCKELIRDLSEVAWSLDSTGAVTTELNKSDKNRTHASDALGYFLTKTFPLKPKIGHQSQGPVLSV